MALSGTGAVVLDAWYSVGGVLQHGLFTNIAGALIKVLDNSKDLGGKPLDDLSQTRRTVVGVSFPSGRLTGSPGLQRMPRGGYNHHQGAI